MDTYNRKIDIMKLYKYAGFAVVLVFFSACSLLKKEPAQKEVKEEKLPEPAPPSSPGKYRATATKQFDLIHTKLKVRPGWEKQYLHGKATLTLTTHFYPQDTLTLDARGFDLHMVAMIKPDTLIPLIHNYDNQDLTILLDKTSHRKDTIKLFIDYTANPNELEAGGSRAITSDRGLYFINPLGKEPDKPRQIWTQGETESNSAWFPTIDKPNQKTTQEIYITVDTAFKTLSNGLLEYSILNPGGTRTDYWHQDKPHAPYLFMMAIGKFSVVRDRWRDSLEVSYYVEPEYKKYARMIFGKTPQMIEFYSNILDFDYPWDKYAQVAVRDFVSGAMENTSATVISENIQQNRREHLDRNYESLIAHELFHQWFGNVVTCESWSNLALNESFATYGEHLWKEHAYGSDEAGLEWLQDYDAYMKEARYEKEKIIRFYYHHREELFNRHRYQKGALVLNMLRDYLGDEAFFASLNHYLRSRAYKPVEYHHLRLAIEEVTGRDMNWFFNQWFRSPGHPVLDIEYHYDSSLNQAVVYTTQTQGPEISTLFKLPVAVDIYNNGDKERYKVTLTKKKDTFTFYSLDRPELINFDAKKVLLAEKEQTKTPAQWHYQLKHAPLFLDKNEAISGFRDYTSKLSADSITAFYNIALNDHFHGTRKLALQAINGFSEKEPVTPFKEKIISLATGDPHAGVRSAAFKALGNFKDPYTLKAFEMGINDSSYNVINNALKGLAKNYPDKALLTAKKFEHSDQEKILYQVGLIYADHGDSLQNGFLRSLMLEKLSRRFKYSILLNYKDYLQRFTDTFILANLDIFKKMTGRAGRKWEKMIIYHSAKNFRKSVVGELRTLSTEMGNNTKEEEKTRELQDKIDSKKQIIKTLDEILKDIEEKYNIDPGSPGTFFDIDR